MRVPRAQNAAVGRLGEVPGGLGVPLDGTEPFADGAVVGGGREGNGHADHSSL
ncbi:hypothetical protein STTU_2116 [Streptomyces sp. Tu6071]|nr:hypothetical protein STTU_2116 [Streptomyces sp. Tu6071]